MAAKELFQCPENGIIIEGAALHDNFISQIRCLPETNHLVEGIFDDRVGKAGGNISHRYTVFWASRTREFMNTVQREPRSTGWGP